MSVPEDVVRDLMIRHLAAVRPELQEAEVVFYVDAMLGRGYVSPDCPPGECRCNGGRGLSVLDRWGST